MKITQNTDVTFDLKTVGIIIFFVAGLAAEYYHLKSEIEEAKELPRIETSEIEDRLSELESRFRVLDSTTKKKK